MTTYNTGNPIGSTAVQDLYDNAENLDIALHTPETTWVDRLGRTRRSWAGSTGYELLGDYEAGITVTSFNQIIRGPDGEFWRAAAGTTLPYVTTGAGLPEGGAFLAIGDAALRMQLSDGSDPANGAAMIGYHPPYGIPALTQAQLNDIFLAAPYVEMFGAKGDGTTDNSTALQAAIDSGAKRLKLGPGHFRIDSDVISSGNITIEGSGPDTVLDFYNGTGQLRVEGSYTALPAPSGQILTNWNHVNFSAPPDLEPGDVIFIYDPADFSWNGARSYYRKGEFLRVHSVVGNRVNIFGGTADTYATGTYSIYKVNPVSLNLANVRLIESSTPSRSAVKVVFGVGVRISNVSGSSSQYTAIELDRCFDFAISDTSTVNYSASNGDDYGITLSNCQKGAVRGGGTEATRHAVAIGGGSAVGAVPCRYITISDMTLENYNSLPADGGGAAPVGDMHSNSEFITYDNCVFKNGAALNGANNTIRNSTIFSMRQDASGVAVYGTEVTRGVLTLENCIIYVEGDGNSGGQGFIRFLGGSALRENSLIMLRNITFRAYASGVSGGSGHLVRVDVNTAQTANQLNVVLDGIHIEISTAFTSVLLARTVDAVSAYPGSILSVDNVSYGGSHRPYLIYPNSTIADVYTREMAQSGSVVVSTATDSPIAVPANNAVMFRMRYSKMPEAQATISSVDGTAGSFVGSDAPVSRVYFLSNEQIRPCAITPDSTNFTAAQSLRLHWRVGINR